MTVILLILLLVLIAVVAFGIVTLRKALHRQTEALGKAYGNVNDLHDGLVKVLGDLKHDLNASIATVDGRVDENAIMLRDNLLEMTTAITKSFMEETIEIKQGVEAIVDALSQVAAPATSEPATASGTPCAVKGCTKPAEVTTSWKMDILSPAEDVSVCEPHAEMMAKQAFQAPKSKAAPPPETVPTKAVAPPREEFAREHGIGEGEPDTSVLTPEPLDPITAAIEASFRAGKQA